MINFKQLFSQPQQQPSYEEAARQQAMADALRERAMRSRVPQAGGPVQAQFGIGEGLAQLAEALIARRAGKSAIGAKKAADVQQTGANRAVISDMTRKPAGVIEDMEGGAPTPMQSRTGIDDSVRLENALGAIGDPQKAGAVLAQAQLGRLLPDPASVADRELKEYKINADIEDKQSAREAQMDRLRFEIAAEERVGRSADALKLQLAKMQADARLSAAEIVAGARRDAASAQGEAKATAADEKKQGRLASLEAARGSLNRVQATSDALGGGGGFIEGRIPAIGPIAQDFDGAKAQLLAAIQNALRTPGIGSQSNMELQALMAALPERTQEKEVRNNQIKGIADRLAIIIAREAGVQTGAPTPPFAPSAGAASTGGLTPQEAAELAQLKARFGK
jgi:hypothetical protein